MPTEDSFKTVMKVLRDPAFAATARDAFRDYISGSEFADRKTPQGLTPAQQWEAVSAIRRLAATVVPVPLMNGERIWYTFPVDSRVCLRTIERHCRSDSRLHRMVQHRTGQRFLVDSQIQEAIATCRIDGIQADPGELGRMLHEGRSPRTPECRVVMNTYEMLGELPSLAAEDFSPALVRHLFERATHGVDPCYLPEGSTGSHGTHPVFKELMHPHAPQDDRAGSAVGESRATEALQQICDYANGRMGDAREPVAVKSYMLLATMSHWRPLPSLNATVARYMLGMLAVKWDFPVLSYLPTSFMTHRWDSGQIEPGVVRYAETEPGARTEDGVDATAEVLIHLQLTCAALNDLRSRIYSAKKEDEGLGRTLHDAGRFNYRQRDVLTQALRCPDAEFTLREHRLAYRTVYSTARADLLELTELGYLRKHARGQAFVFSPSPDLRSRLGPERGQTD